jgi:hypothetical protein
MFADWLRGMCTVFWHMQWWIVTQHDAWAVIVGNLDTFIPVAGGVYLQARMLNT